MASKTKIVNRTPHDRIHSLKFACILYQRDENSHFLGFSLLIDHFQSFQTEK